MTLGNMDGTMALEIDNCVVVTARFGGHAAVDGNGVLGNSTHAAQLFAATRWLRHRQSPSWKRDTRTTIRSLSHFKKSCPARPAHQVHNGPEAAVTS
jgi:hypothetical protein